MMNISNFFDTNYSDLASYDNLRKIASYVDGLKNSSRKVIYTILDKKLYNLQKVMQLSAECAKHTIYLHGSLDGVVTSLGKDYMGSNQLPLLKKKGNFGTRAIPEASAPRYISACGADYLKKIFLDECVYPQKFEGEDIEPKYLVPVLPLLVINGSTGVSFGYAQTIYSRNMDEVKKLLIKALKRENVDFNVLLPYFKDFKGSVQKIEENKYLVKGCYNVEITGNKAYIRISEITPNNSFLKYASTMNDLVDNGEILDFIDESSDVDANFTIVIDRKQLTNDSLDGEDLKSTKLRRKFKLEEILTENLTTIDTNNKIKIFNNIDDLIKTWLTLRIAFSEVRQSRDLENLNNQISKLKSICLYINDVRNNIIDIKVQTETSLKQYFASKNFYEENDYKYLLRLPLTSLTSENLMKYAKDIETIEHQYNTLLNTSVDEILIQEIEAI